MFEIILEILLIPPTGTGMRFAKKHDHDVEIDAYPSGVHINRSCTDPVK
jgi:hypothetical protein